MRALKLFSLAGAAAAAVLLGSGAAAMAPANAAPAAHVASVEAHSTSATPDSGSDSSKTSNSSSTTDSKTSTSLHKVSGTPCSSNADACVDLSANRAWLIQNGKVEYGPVPITHGTTGSNATPPGTFAVSFKDKNHKSSQFNNAPMPNSVFFNHGIAFHEGSLRELSHGCIHLSPTASLKFFNTLQPGDVVQVAP